MKLNYVFVFKYFISYSFIYKSKFNKQNSVSGMIALVFVYKMDYFFLLVYISIYADAGRIRICIEIYSHILVSFYCSLPT